MGKKAYKKKNLQYLQVLSTGRYLLFTLRDIL